MTLDYAPLFAAAGAVVASKAVVERECMRAIENIDHRLNRAE
jgi:hypothetical protein